MLVEIIRWDESMFKILGETQNLGEDGKKEKLKAEIARVVEVAGGWVTFLTEKGDDLKEKNEKFYKDLVDGVDELQTLLCTFSSIVETSRSADLIEMFFQILDLGYVLVPTMDGLIEAECAEGSTKRLRRLPSNERLDLVADDEIV